MVGSVGPSTRGRWGVVVAAAILGGCSDPGSPGQDAGPDAPGASGVALQWQASTPVPGPASPVLELGEVHLTASSLRVVGDAAPGDPRTTRGELTLEWGDRPPPPSVFEVAPAGRYGLVEVGVGGDHEAYEVHGRVEVGGVWSRFEIHDEVALGITIPTDFVVGPGQLTTQLIAIDLAAVAAAVDFAQVPVDGEGVRAVTSTDPQIGAVRRAWAGAFTAVAP